MLKNPLYIIYFNDGTQFIGGTIKETKWMQMPDKMITKLVYFLPSGEKIELEDYEAYYHFVEVTSDLNGKNAGKVNLEYSYLIAKDEDFYDIMKINLKTSEVMTNIESIPSERIETLTKIGWKLGFKKGGE